jgi:adenylate cyclase
VGRDCLFWGSEHLPADQAIVDRAPRAEPSSRRQLWFSLLVLSLLCIFCAPFFVNQLDQAAPSAKAGVLDLSTRSGLERPVSLDGEWQFVWQSELGVKAKAEVPPDYMRVPGVWEGQRSAAGPVYPQQGRAIYNLVISGLKPGTYRLYVPTLYTASTLSIDGRVRAIRGRVGDDAASTRYYWRAEDISFETTGAPVKLSIEMAAFLHRDSGFEISPILGNPESMQTLFAQRWMQELLFQASLMLLSIYCGVVFLFRRSDRPSLYFGIACLTFMPVTAMLGFDNIIQILFPNLSFPTLLGIVYLSTGVSMIFFLSYGHTLFPKESPSWAFRALVTLISLFFGAQAVTLSMGDTLLTTQINGHLWVIFVIYFPYVFLVLVRAVIRNRDGSVPFLIGMGAISTSITMIEIVAAGLMTSEEVKGFNFTTYGILIMLFSHLVVLAERWALSIRASERTNADLRQLLEVNSSITSEIDLESLLKRIVQTTSRIISAERSTLFLHDVKTDSLWSLVAEGLGTKEIRMPATQGLAGEAFQKGEIIVTADAYKHPAFNPESDRESGFVTRNVVSMPIVTREGRRLGVMQALNRTDGGAFTRDDVVRMRAFASQAAIALDNATLFSEVVAAKNYNESILSSMSSGVVTLDIDGNIAKVNDAACEILGTDQASLDGASARAILEATNPWFIEEIEAVEASGTAKSLLDTDINTRSGATKSVNLSLVPLINEGKQAGILTILEDISEGKRLQGAMRRFMPQKIVDQVLERDDDLLFGSACKASVLFADIRGFTSLSEKLTPREVVDMLNEVFTELYEAVAGSEGILDKYIGDAVMAVYGVPFAHDNDPENAVCGAMEMLRMIDVINQRRSREGALGLRLGVGVSTGDVIAGTIGSPKRMDYTVIGDSVNLAARLQDLSKVYRSGIILCETTAAKVAGTVPLRELDLIRVRGRQTPARIFEVVDGAAIEAEAYQQGRAALVARDWASAISAFETVLASNPSDGAAILMINRAHAARSSPPPDDWDGVW